MHISAKTVKICYIDRTVMENGLYLYSAYLVLSTTQSAFTVLPHSLIHTHISHHVSLFSIHIAVSTQTLTCRWYIRGNFEFSILPKDIYTCWVEEPWIETTNLPVSEPPAPPPEPQPLISKSYNHTRKWVNSVSGLSKSPYLEIKLQVSTHEMLQEN